MNNKVTEEVILSNAVELIRKGGELSTRNLAKQIGCSTQPIYTLFKNVADLEERLYPYIQSIHKIYIKQYMDKNIMPEYKAYGMGFVKFAKSERNLFNYIYIDKPFDRQVLENDKYFIEVVNTIQKIYGVSRELALQFHLDMTVYTYGLAVMQNANSRMTDEELSQRLMAQFTALSKLYFEGNK